MLELLIFVLYCIVSFYIIRKSSFFRINSVPLKWINIFWSAKIIGSISLFLIYTHYYTDRSTADIFKFYDDSKIMFDAIYTNFGDFFKMLFGFTSGNEDYFKNNYYQYMNHWYREVNFNTYNDSRTIIRIHAFLRIFSFGYYNVNALFFTFFAFTGLVGVYKVFETLLSKLKLAFAFFIFLSPSLLIWSSGGMKEALLVGAIGLFVYFLMKLLEKQNWLYLFGLMVVTLIFLLSKFYVLAALSIGIPAYLIVRLKKQFNSIPIYLANILIITAIGLNLKHIHPELDILNTLENKQRDYIGHVEHENPGSKIILEDLEPTIESFLSNLPQALINGFTRPFIWKFHSIFSFASAIETWFILILLGMALIYRDSIQRKQLNLILLSATFVVFLYLIIGWITPVEGAIVRYKVPGLPFLYGICFLLLDKNVLIKYTDKIKRK